jgi:creatinine amidohydrolase/Fe(II)-dependent formamide hydrolase-like protein
MEVVMGRLPQIRTVRVMAVATVLAAAASSVAQVLEVATLNTEQIRALDRQKTAVILVGGILEEHGPYLPAYTDGYSNERVARDLAEAVAARPGWLLFPPIPLGSGGASEIGRKYAFPGSFNRTGLHPPQHLHGPGRRAGRSRLPVGLRRARHGSPPHNHALDQAARYFEETHEGRMVHLLGGMGGSQAPAWRKLVSPEALAEDGSSVHAGLREHSEILFLRPELVSPALRDARSVQTDGFKGLEPAARAADWPGYFGAPRHASSAVGAATQKEGSAEIIAEVLRILDGSGTPALPRYADAVIGSPEIRGIVADATVHDARREGRQRAWIEKQPAWPPPVATPRP